MVNQGTWSWFDTNLHRDYTLDLKCESQLLRPSTTFMGLRLIIFDPRGVDE
jgi:hypothetical protein